MTTGFLDFVHRPVFQKTEEHNVSETGSVACFANVASATFTGNAIYRHNVPSVANLFWVWFSRVSYAECFCFEDCPNVVLIRYAFELLRNTLNIRDIHRAERFFLFFPTTTALGPDSRVNKTLGITTELKITSQVICLNQQVLSFLA
jgi:hypothetical protein